MRPTAGSEGSRELAGIRVAAFFEPTQERFRRPEFVELQLRLEAREPSDLTNEMGEVFSEGR
jgi:hypothetical protein